MTEYQAKSEDAVRFYIDLANDVYNLNLPYPCIRWNLRGATAGKAACGIGKWEVQLHPVLVEQEGQDYVDRTPGHEVAHLVAFKVHGLQRSYRGRRQSHGWAWKSVMRKLGLDPTRCHTYDTSAVKQTRKKADRPYVYKCGCMEHKLTSIRHRRFMSGKYRCLRCTRCKVELQFVEIRP